MMTWENFSQNFPLLPIVMNAGRYGSLGVHPLYRSSRIQQRPGTGRSEGGCREIGCPDYTVLFSTREFKRVPNVRMQENGGDVS